MLEMLQISPRSHTPEVLINIDFTDATPGTPGLVDLAGNIWTKNTATGQVSMVEVDPVHGKFMRFDKRSYFTAPTGDKLKFADKSFVLEMEYQCYTAGVHAVFATGDWNLNRLPGFAIDLGSIPATYVQCFCLNTSGAFVRLLPPSTTNQLVHEKLVLRRSRGDSLQLSVYRNDMIHSQINTADFSFGDGGPILAIGTSVTNLGSNNAELKLFNLKVTSL